MLPSSALQEISVNSFTQKLSLLDLSLFFFPLLFILTALIHVSAPLYDCLLIVAHLPPIPFAFSVLFRELVYNDILSPKSGLKFSHFNKHAMKIMYQKKKKKKEKGEEK